MTLDIEKWLNKKIDDTTVYFKVGDEVALVRPLSGLEFDAVQQSRNSGGSTYLGWLQYELLHGERKEPFSLELVSKFFDAHPATAIKIANKISTITLEALNAERQKLEDAEKNSDGTGTQEPSENGVAATASPRSAKSRPSAN